MKTKLFTALLALSLPVAVLPSCSYMKQANTAVTTMDPARAKQIDAVVQLGSQYAASVAIKKNPKSADVMAIVADVIDVAVQTKDFQPTNVQSKISSALANQDPAIVDLANLGLELAMLKYSDFYNQNINTYKDDITIYGGFLSAISGGMRSAVAQYRAAPAVAAQAPGTNPMVALTPSTLKL